MASIAWADTDLAESQRFRNSFSFEYENDMLVGEDGGYTSGLRLSWSNRDKSPPNWLIRTANAFPLFPEITQEIVWESSFSQTMFTPDDIAEPEYPPDDRPYAGWLTFGFHIGSIQEARRDRLSVLLGVVGPGAGARRTQIFVHELTGSDEPVGWETQLPNEPALVVAYDTARRLFHGEMGNSERQWEFTPIAGVALGNIITEGSAGFYYRLGKNIPRDIGPPRIGAIPKGSGLFQPTGNRGWYVFGGLEGRYVVHNIFLDGSLFHDTPSVNKRDWVGELSGGAAMQWGANRVTYTTLLRSREFDNQQGSELYGAISYSRLF